MESEYCKICDKYQNCNKAKSCSCNEFITKVNIRRVRTRKL